MKFGNTTIGGMSFGSTRIGGAKLGNTLVFSGGPSPVLPYTPVKYIETDGTAYITTRITGTPPRSSEIKVMLGGTAMCGILCAYTVPSSYDSKNFALLKCYNKYTWFAFYYNFGSADGVPSVAYSVDNNKPFIVKTSIKKGAQSISVKEENSDSWVTVSKAQNYNVSSTYGLTIFNGYQGGSYSLPAPAGTRLYYCKIYSDENYTTLVRNFVPCYYNGEYGLWDKVSDTFFGNAAGSGAFTGPSINQ